MLLTAATLLTGVQELCLRDADLARIVAEFGMPPLWVREPGFPTLIAIILEQQVSLASARAAFTRLLDIASPLTPERLLALSDTTLGACGFSRQKIGYSRGIAEAVFRGGLDLQALTDKEDAEVRAVLTGMKGLGHWSADVYLMMALRRLDIWPVGDRALVVATRHVKGLAAYPTPEEMTRLGADWRPLRSIAAHLLWHDYLSRRAVPAKETRCPDRTA